MMMNLKEQCSSGFAEIKNSILKKDQNSYYISNSSNRKAKSFEQSISYITFLYLM